MQRSVLLVVLACAALASCELRPPHAVISIEDPDRAAQNAFLLLFGTESGLLQRRPILERRFPITVALTSDSDDEKLVQIEAWSGTNDVLARGFVRTSFSASDPPTAIVTLGAPCETTEDCDDGLYCNGEETCESRVCRRGAEPCAPSPFGCVIIGCVEGARSCSVGVDHAVCPPIVDFDGNTEPAYCDPSVGCARGIPCYDDSVCQDAAACNGREQCIGGHCVAGPPPQIDDGISCTIDACVEPAGPAHFVDEFNEGRACTMAAGGGGICSNGRCLDSLCGDALTDLATETCDDGNQNPNDGCDTCLATEWLPEIISGLGAGGGDPLRTPLPYPEEIAVDRRGTIYVGDSELGVVYALDPTSGQTRIAAGAGTADLDSAGLGGPATQATFDLQGLAVDARGHLYLSDFNDSRVVRVDAETGLIQPFAGNGESLGTSGAEGPALQIPLGDPTDIFVDGRGNVYFTESAFFSRVAKVDAITGVLATLAGTGEDGYSGDGGPAAQAQLNYPDGVVVDADGNVFIADTFNSIVRIIDGTTGIIDTYAGTGWPGFSGDNGPATAAELYFPDDLALDGMGHLLINDGARIRRVDRITGVISTIAGTGSSGFSGDGGPARFAEISDTPGITTDTAGHIYLADRDNGRVRRIDAASGTIETVMGDLASGSGGARAGSPATSTPVSVTWLGLAGEDLIFTNANRIYRLETSSGLIFLEHSLTSTESIAAITVTASGDIVVAHDYVIERLDRTTGARTLLAGDGTPGFGNVVHVAEDPAGHLYYGTVGSTGNHIRRVDGVTGAITTVAGTGPSAFSGDGGAATAAGLSVRGITFDTAGHLYFADRINSRVRRIDRVTGVISTVAGNGTAGTAGDGGPATAASLQGPQSVAFDAAGRLLIADDGRDANRLRRVDLATGLIETIAGTGSLAPRDGVAATQSGGSFNHALATAAGDIYVAAGDRIRKIDAATGVITSVAGAIFPHGDGTLPQSQLGAPGAMARIGPGRWVIADGPSGRLREVDTGARTQRTVAGYPDGEEESGAEAAYARLFGVPTGIAYDDAEQQLYVAESSFHQVRRVDLSAPVWRVHDFAGQHESEGFLDAGAAEAEMESPSGLAIDAARRVLYVADTGNHVVRAIDLADPAHPVTTVAGRPRARGYGGDGEPATSALLNEPRAIAVAPTGELYVADTGNRRVRRVDAAGLIHDVLGDGSAGSSGSGSPARTLGAGEPLGLLLDPAGNLFVASEDTVRIVSAGPDGVATGDDEVLIIYGTPPADRFPESLTRCLSGLGFGEDSGTAVVVLDRCRGFMIELERRSIPFGG